MIILLSALAAAAPFLIQIFTNPAGAINSYGILTMIVYLLSRFFLGIVFIVYADGIARWLFPVEERLRFSLDADHLQRVLFATVGIYFIIHGLSEMATATYILFTSPEWIDDPAIRHVWEQRRENLVPALVQFLAGAGLLLGRDGISRFWRRLRPMSDEPGT